jgi:hypothetical protein
MLYSLLYLCIPKGYSQKCSLTDSFLFLSRSCTGKQSLLVLRNIQIKKCIIKVLFALNGVLKFTLKQLQHVSV